MTLIIGLAAVARSGKDTVASMLLEHPEVAAYALADPLKAGCQALFGLTDEETWSDDIKEKTIQIWGMSPRQMFQRVGTEWLRDHNPDHWLARADRQLNHSAPEVDPAATAPPHARPESSALPASSVTTAPSDAVLAQDVTTSSLAVWLAVQAIWGLEANQTWDSACRDIKDPFWGMTPSCMYSIINTYLSRDFPTYITTRTQRPIEAPKPKSLDLTKKPIFVIKDIRFENEAKFWRNHNGVIWHIVRNNATKVHDHSSERGIIFLPGDVLIENNGTLEQLRLKIDRAWKSAT